MYKKFEARFPDFNSLFNLLKIAWFKNILLHVQQ